MDAADPQRAPINVMADSGPNPFQTKLELANRALRKQVAACRQQLDQVQHTLLDAQQVMTQHAHLEAERIKLLAAERELNELKSSFVLLASHEFRTPMMTILSSVSLISRYNGPDDGANRERHVQRIKTAVATLTSILTDFTAISQLDQNTVRPLTQALDLQLFCQQLLIELGAMVKPGQQVHYQHLGGATRINLDDQLLKTILLNLLSNASKYSAEDTAIYLTSEVWADGLRLSVQDQGIGIPDTDKDRLFTTFFRSRNAIHIQGTGLGLYLAKRYVDLLGGTIRFVSQVGQGTTFVVELPVNAPVV